MSFENQLVKWYLNNKRELPWRENIDPYRVWISEIILQQTRVVQGEKYFNNFIKKFPSLESLSSADESEVLKIWKGLGYYNRAINIHKTSKKITNTLNGVFPNTYNELIKLNGIGDYTASAISSICFNEYNPVVDGNVLRLISRYYGLKTPIDSLKGQRNIREIGKKLISKVANPGDFNQAMMEYGALVCTPFPDCESCVFSSKCIAYINKEVDSIPVKSKKKKPKERFLNYIVFIDSKQKTIVNKRTNKDIWYKLNEFPLIESKTEIKNIHTLTDLKKLIDNLSLTILKEKEKIYRIKHILSHQILYISFYQICVKETITSGVHLSNLNNYNFPVPITNFINKLLI
ncbi:A/G-specific adenine glycosylase [Flavobacteriaceae bacterium]|jgi:A/G-specific adenine glycosylase|nr:A/G-specific adenine glycosylase [Flavobacteriaceae bacterium]MDC1010236.1 A/G-specific adenine glycosylase [Flavobacteriaceae bacterium]MDC3297632.1 A/G-specific adenine glycosylase [Flavobacteriaceae bacterium]